MSRCWSRGPERQVVQQGWVVRATDRDSAGAAMEKMDREDAIAIVADPVAQADRLPRNGATIGCVSAATTRAGCAWQRCSSRPCCLQTSTISGGWLCGIGAGSVDTAVNEARWRDLAVSFATLLVLGASMAMIVVSTQRAQRLARLQMEFVAGISHELRTPLTVISTAAQNLSDGIVEGKPQVKVYGTLIRNESRRLSGMMEQILQFASGQKKRKYDPAPLAPAELIDSALTLAGSLLQDAGTTVELQVAPDLPNVMGESGALMQCLHNLIANGIKYGGDAKWLGVRAWADQEAVWIAVEDHGIGIEKAELPHIFDPFYRSSAVTSAQIHGTGLGLSLARNFAQEAGGSITVESTPGQGSTFLVRLPAMRAAVAEAARLSERTA